VLSLKIEGRISYRSPTALLVFGQNPPDIMPPGLNSFSDKAGQIPPVEDYLHGTLFWTVLNAAQTLSSFGQHL